MTVILSCGHEENDFDKHYNIMTKGEDVGVDGWHRTISYMTVCGSCKHWYQENNDILYNEEEAMEWLNGDELSR